MNNKIKETSFKSNFIYQLIYQIIILIIPLIISPYLTRVLGETNLGIYNYTYSIAYYFVIFAMLGIFRYGQRIISERRNDEIKLRKTFWSLFTVHIIFSIISFIFYLLFCLFVFKNDYIIFILQSFYVLSALFDITWLFYGLENFKSVVYRNVFIKVLECILIFTLVKSKDDLVIYTLIMSLSVLIGMLSVLPLAIKLLKPIKFNINDMREHIKPLFILFVAVLGSTIYVVFDKTLLGMMIDKESVAFYEYSNKIILVPKTIISAIGTVLFPKACLYLKNRDFEGVSKYFKFSIISTYFIAFASIFGILGVADTFAIIYYGESFAICGSLIKWLSPVILIIGMGEIVRSLYIIPLKRDIQYIRCSMYTALLNLFLSVIFIKITGIYGAIIGTVIAELFSTVYQIIISKKEFDFKYCIINIWPFLVSGILMYVFVIIFKRYFDGTILYLVCQIIIGAFVYLTILALYYLFISKDRDKIKQYIIDNFKKIKNKKLS